MKFTRIDGIGIIRHNKIKCYNAATMRYEQADHIFLCIGVRGFDYEGPLFTRLSPED
jgi:hypothetical protein